jgi:hypothetical protein
MPEWVIVNGHALGECAYLASLDEPWEPESPCDCRDHEAFDDLDEEFDDYGSGDLAYEGSW